MSNRALTLGDIFVGQEFRSGEILVTADSIKAFAREFDPQPMHLDQATAQQGPFGRLTASGWQTLSLTMRLMAQTKPFGETPLIGVGVDAIKFLKPVFANTSILVTAVVTTKRSSSKPGRGFVKMKLTTIDKSNNEPVLTQIWTVLVPQIDNS